MRDLVLVDSHAHLDSPRYDADREELLQRAWQQGVRTVLSIGIGDGPDTMQQALELSKSYAGKPGIPRLLATAGIDAAGARRLAADICAGFETPLLCAGGATVGVSVGVAMYPDDAEDNLNLLRCAEAALRSSRSRASGEALRVV